MSRMVTKVLYGRCAITPKMGAGIKRTKRVEHEQSGLGAVEAAVVCRMRVHAGGRMHWLRHTAFAAYGRGAVRLLPDTDRVRVRMEGDAAGIRGDAVGRLHPYHCQHL